MIVRISFGLFLVGLFAGASLAGDLDLRLNILEETLKKQQATIEEQQKTINQLRQELSALGQRASDKGAEKASRATQADQVAATEQKAAPSGLFGGSALTNPYISFTLNTFFYSSSVGEREFGNRGIPGFSILGFDREKGFNISEGELFLFAPVDPYFNLYANIPVTEDGAELEEAFFVTTFLPEGLQLKGGKFKSGFSRLNAQHPHAWDFVDPPLAYRAFLGGEGIIEKGIQLTYLPRLPIYTLLGIEVLQGENEIIFNQRATGGPRAFTGFAKGSFDFGDSTILLGPYVLTGRTKTDTIAEGTFFRGSSTLYGFETVYKWRPSRTKSLVIYGEYLWRAQKGDLDARAEESALLDLSSGVTSRLTRSQDGMYVQSLYQIDRWRLGARYDRLALFSDTVRLAGRDPSFKSPWRLTGALEFNPSEFARLRLQYNHDRSGGDGRTNREVFLQMILGIGAHAAHAF